MCSGNTTSFIGKIGLLFSLCTIIFLASDASAQCYCKNTRHHARKRVARTYRTTLVARPVRVYNAPGDYRFASDNTVITKGYSSRAVDRYVVEDDNGEIIYDADYRDTARIATDYGYRDGWIDGEDAGMERDVYHPENSGDYQKAANGYEDDFGSKRLYKHAYRQAYLKGYRAGFRSVASRYTMRNYRNY